VNPTRGRFRHAVDRVDLLAPIRSLMTPGSSFTSLRIAAKAPFALLIPRFGSAVRTLYLLLTSASHDAPRSLRVRSISKIPELLEQMIKDGTKIKEDVMAQIETVDALTNGLAEDDANERPAARQAKIPAKINRLQAPRTTELLKDPLAAYCSPVNGLGILEELTKSRILGVTPTAPDLHSGVFDSAESQCVTAVKYYSSP
jgi:hypothetical protein